MTGICQNGYKRTTPCLYCFRFVFPPVLSHDISCIASVCV